MWNYSRSNKCFFKFDLENEKFCYTDLNSVYVEKCINQNLIKKRFKELNPRIDFEEELVVKSLYSIPKICNIEKNNSNLLLSVKYEVDGDMFAFSWHLNREVNEIKESLVHPLLLALNSLHNQNNELLDIIEKKDAEIEQYKFEGAVLKRRLVATKKFKKLEFNSKHIHVNVTQMLEYAQENVDSLKDSCKQFIQALENVNTSTGGEINGCAINQLDKKIIKTKRKRAFELRRQQNLEKVKQSKQEKLYEDD